MQLTRSVITQFGLFTGLRRLNGVYAYLIDLIKYLAKRSVDVAFHLSDNGPHIQTLCIHIIQE